MAVIPWAYTQPAEGLPRDWEPNDAERGGFASFWSYPARDEGGADYRRGRERAKLRAYGAGVKASLAWAAARDAWEISVTAEAHGGAPAGPEPEEADCPWPQFSPAWEAWADGFNEEEGL